MDLNAEYQTGDPFSDQLLKGVAVTMFAFE